MNLPLASAAFALGLVLALCVRVTSAADTVVEAERAPDRVTPDGPLGTTGYEPTRREQPFVKKTPADGLADGDITDNDTPYVLADRAGKRVAWFGIVREVRKAAGKGDGYELLLEHKFFDGLTDVHILALSFNGAGDFVARVAGDGPPPELLSLVRAYGKVTADGDAGKADKPAKGDKADADAEGEGDAELPVLDSEYVRVFPWKTFTFIAAYGKDASNPKWRELNKVALDDVYDPTPDDAYYEQRLGKREPPPADGQKPAGPREAKEPKPRTR
jgi:hypothetical protein